MSKFDGRTRATYVRDLERAKWQSKYSCDYMNYIRSQNVCICCGKSKVTSDHITPKLRLYRNGLKIGESQNQIIESWHRGNIQFLCETCQCSKRDGFVCGVHNRYLGVWNYLPKLENIE